MAPATPAPIRGQPRPRPPSLRQAPLRSSDIASPGGSARSDPPGRPGGRAHRGRGQGRRSGSIGLSGPGALLPGGSRLSRPGPTSGENRGRSRDHRFSSGREQTGGVSGEPADAGHADRGEGAARTSRSSHSGIPVRRLRSPWGSETGGDRSSPGSRSATSAGEGGSGGSGGGGSGGDSGSETAQAPAGHDGSGSSGASSEQSGQESPVKIPTGSTEPT